MKAYQIVQVDILLRELGVTLCIGNELVCREAMHVYAAAGGTRARMGLHVPTADVMS
jgi:hypothetical protein